MIKPVVEAVRINADLLARRCEFLEKAAVIHARTIADVQLLQEISRHERQFLMKGLHGGLRFLADVLPFLLDLVPVGRVGIAGRLIAGGLRFGFDILQFLPEFVVIGEKLPLHAALDGIGESLNDRINLFGVEYGEFQTVIVFLTAVGHEPLYAGICQ